MLALNRLIKQFKKESKYNKVKINGSFDNYIMNKEVNEIIFNIDKEIEELNMLNDIYKSNSSLIYNGLKYKIKNISYNVPTYNAPIAQLKINII